jgi:hypothetical protein
MLYAATMHKWSECCPLAILMGKFLSLLSATSACFALSAASLCHTIPHLMSMHRQVPSIVNKESFAIALKLKTMKLFH